MDINKTRNILYFNILRVLVELAGVELNHLIGIKSVFYVLCDFCVNRFVHLQCFFMNFGSV